MNGRLNEIRKSFIFIKNKIINKVKYDLYFTNLVFENSRIYAGKGHLNISNISLNDNITCTQLFLVYLEKVSENLKANSVFGSYLSGFLVIFFRSSSRFLLSFSGVMHL